MAFPLAGFVGGIFSTLGGILGGGSKPAAAAAPPPPAPNYTPWLIAGGVAFVGVILAIVLGTRK